MKNFVVYRFINKRFYQKNKAHFFFFLIYQFLYIIWYFNVQNSYFKAPLINNISLIITALLPLLLKINIKKSQLPLSLLLIVIPIITYFSIEYFILQIDYPWFILNLSVFLTGFILINIQISMITKILSLLCIISIFFIQKTPLPNQKKYFGKVVHSIKTEKGKSDIIQWKNHSWLYYNDQLSFSTEDGHMYSETMVHPVRSFYTDPSILLIGGDNGMSLSELLKYSHTEIDHIPFDKELFLKLQSLKYFSHFPQDLYFIKAQNAYHFLMDSKKNYDIIIIDLLTPTQLPSVNHYYQSAFYQLCKKHLSDSGVIITNSGDFFGDTFLKQDIQESMKKIFKYHKFIHIQIPTLGQQSFIIGGESFFNLSNIQLKVPTKWINEDVMQMIQFYGKMNYPHLPPTHK